MLVSQDFIASNYIHTVELRKAFERMRQGTTKIFPVLVKKCNFKNWKALPESILSALKEKDREDYAIGKYQFLPQNDKNRLKAINQWTFPEDAWVQVSERLEKLL